MAISENSRSWRCPDWPVRALWTAVLALAALELFSELLSRGAVLWRYQPQYAHAWLVPPAAVAVGWARRHQIAAGVARSSRYGPAVLLLSIALHFSARQLLAELLDWAALLLCLTGILLTVWGRRLLAGIWPAVLFLVFLVPLPEWLETAFASPLQSLAARETAFFIQILGIPAVGNGPQIEIADQRIFTASVFSGLRMFWTFLAVSVGTILISQRDPWEKAVIVFNAVPNAMFCNGLRIVVAGAALHQTGIESSDQVLWGLSALLLTPLAVLLVCLELRLLDWLLVPVADPVVRLRGAVTPGIVPVAAAGSQTSSAAAAANTVRRF